MKRLIAISCIVLSALSAAAQVKPHPRLLEAPVLQENAPWYIRQIDSTITAFSKEVLAAPPCERKMTGRRLLGTSREVLKRVFWLSYTYRAHGGGEYARRAVDEMLAASSFTDWNPSHFLDVGEMTMALSIGYDWLYDRMSVEERKTIAAAIIEKGLKPALNASDAWFYDTEINWNSVCNAGMVYGALAVWEEAPEFCRDMLEKSLKSKQLAYNAYSEDGGFPEGYNYWGYGTSFQIMMEAVLETAVLPEGFLKSARFMQFMSTPAGRCFSFSDCYGRANFQPMQAWMAAKTGNLSILDTELRLLKMGLKPAEERLLPFFLLYAPVADIPRPQGNVFHSGGTTPVYIYREGWDSTADDYLALKGGLAQSSHSHQDQGAFFFESDGVAWATDLGMQEYNSLESIGLDLWDMTQESERWEVFRIGPWSHNIITVNGHAPKVNHAVDFSGFYGGRRHGAAMDLKALYDEDLAACRREVWLEDGVLHVMDYLEAGDKPCEVRWAMCTEASAKVRKGAVILRSGRQKRTLRAFCADIPLTPAVWSASYPGPYLHEYDAPNPGRTMTGYTFSLMPGQKVQLHVVL